MEPLGGRHEITAEWLTEALREGGHLPRGRVSAVEVNTDGIGIGYISETVRIVPTYEGADGTAPTSLVAKLPVAVDFPEYLKPWAAQAVETAGTARRACPAATGRRSRGGGRTRCCLKT